MKHIKEYNQNQFYKRITQTEFNKGIIKDSTSYKSLQFTNSEKVIISDIVNKYTLDYQIVSRGSGLSGFTITFREKNIWFDIYKESDNWYYTKKTNMRGGDVKLYQCDSLQGLRFFLNDIIKNYNIQPLSKDDKIKSICNLISKDRIQLDDEQSEKLLQCLESLKLKYNI